MGKGSLSSAAVIPIGDSKKTTRRLPHLIDAMSDIQQYYIFESTGQEIPHEFLTIRDSLGFFNTGFGAGFFEGLMFSILLTICMPLVIDTHAMNVLTTAIPFLGSPWFLIFFSITPVLFACALCCWMGKYYVGSITKRAIDNLLLGRATSLFLTGFLLFTILTTVGALLTPARAYSAGMYLAGVFPAGSMIPQTVYDILLNLPPIMVRRAIHQGIILITGVALPYLTIWGVVYFRDRYISYQNSKIGH